MTPERWARVDQLYHEALTLDASERATFLADACASDDRLRREIESLLAHDGGAAFLSTPAVANEIGEGIRIGQTLGSYVISARIGEGGMGEVYRARDAKLGRDVAIKILPHAFAADPDRLARFEREARMLASLNHPHIGSIYGLEDGTVGREGQVGPFLVMELVAGEDLSQRIARGAIPLDEALPIAKQIAEALEAAHEQGITHRDLKPANIKIRPDGTAKILDFGLAKAMEPASALRASAGQAPGGAPNVSQPPIIAMTQAGVILGTAAYMSPEQARGRVVDKRTDIWAFGCVVYEMLVGRPAFTGDTLSDTLAAIIEREPNWQALPEFTPSSVRRLLRRCLEKDPKRRLPDIADARIEIDDAQTTSSDARDEGPTAAPGSARAKTREHVGWVVEAASLAGLIAVLVFGRAGSGDRTPANTSSFSTSIVLPAGVRLSSGSPPGRFAVSPDGRRLAMVATDSTGRSALWVRSLDSRVPQALGGTEGAMYPFWSPDSRFIAFLAQNKLKKVDVSGSDVSGAFTVSETGVLAYQTESLVRSQLTWFDRAGTQIATLGDPADYVDVALSPDDRRVAVSLMDLQRGTRDLWIFDVARRLGERFTYESGDDFGPNWSRPGGDRIFFSSLRKGSIDLYEKPSRGSGSETLLLEDDLGKFNASASPDGRFLVYVGGGGVIGQSDIWVLPLFGEKKPAPFLETRFVESQGQFSPDGRWVAFWSWKSGRPEVYVTTFPGRETEQQVSTAGGGWPRWNRNGKEIFYLAPDNTLRVTPVNGQTSRFDVGISRPLFQVHPRLSRFDAYPYDVTADGQRIIVNTLVEEVTPPITLVVNWLRNR